MQSVSFDRAADSYDETRALPPHVAPRLTAALLAELRAAGAGRLLEVGIGTGRITRPLMERGVRVAGVDIAPRMLERLRAQLTPRHAAPDLALGDATRLPFRDGSFRAALAVHVFHLVSDWRAALAELRRVIAPGGVFIHHVTRYLGENPWRASLDARDRVLGELGITLRPRPADDDTRAALRAAGGSIRTVTYARDEERSAPSQWLERTRARIDSWSWAVPDDRFPDFYARYEQACRDVYGDLDCEFLQQVDYELEVWSFP
jgi:SAM-dependent methyltransferase